MNRLVLCAAIALVACESLGSKPAPPPPPVAAKPPPPPPVEKPAPDITAQDYAMPALPHRRVTLTDARGGKHVVDAEVASTRDQRTRGLMWRTVLPEGTGMLFIFEQEEWLSFWMRNTLIPLDMIFARADLTIVGIVENAEPKTLSPRTPGNVRSQYVLEVPGGWAAKVGLKPGSKLEVEALGSLTPTP